MSRFYTPQREQTLSKSRKGKPTGTGVNALKAALAAANKEGKSPKMAI